MSAPVTPTIEVLTAADCERLWVAYFAVKKVAISHLPIGPADLTGVPIVLNIDAAILAAVEMGGTLDMAHWHGVNPHGRMANGCGTNHCRAGWAIHLAGKAGYTLERLMEESEAAAALIYAASRPGQQPPSFFVDNEAALADLRACAAEIAEAQP